MNQINHPSSQRLNATELAQVLDNLGAACRQPGIKKRSFSEYKKRFQEMGIDGIKDLPVLPKTHPHSISEDTVKQIIALSLEHPAWGCVRLSEDLKTKGIHISSPTIQNILIKQGLGKKHERLLKLEEKATQESYSLSTEQIRLIEKTNPYFRESFSKISRPGELLAQDTIFVSLNKDLGKIYLQVVIDSFSSYAFGFLHNTKLPDNAVAILHNDVFPFFKDRKIPVKTILTNNSREYCGKENHHFELYLSLNDVEHQRTSLHYSNGLVKRFSRIVLTDFFKKVFQEKIYHTLESLQFDLDSWLRLYNESLPLQGYPHPGKIPAVILSEYLNTQSAK
ncbi:MAG TPA: helix-turn-helix domain-containing protein [Bacillota bacterium]|nr:helix-turn-helix domain-containing protein [Bacillota bacterium]